MVYKKKKKKPGFKKPQKRCFHIFNKHFEKDEREVSKYSVFFCKSYDKIVLKQLNTWAEAIGGWEWHMPPQVQK